MATEHQPTNQILRDSLLQANSKILKLEKSLTALKKKEMKTDNGFEIATNSLITMSEHIDSLNKKVDTLTEINLQVMKINNDYDRENRKLKKEVERLREEAKEHIEGRFKKMRMLLDKNKKQTGHFVIHTCHYNGMADIYNFHTEEEQQAVMAYLDGSEGDITCPTQITLMNRVESRVYFQEEGVEFEATSDEEWAKEEEEKDEDKEKLICPYCERDEDECEKNTESEKNPITNWEGWGLSCDDCYYKNNAETDEEEEEEKTEE